MTHEEAARLAAHFGRLAMGETFINDEAWGDELKAALLAYHAAANDDNPEGA